MSKKSRFGRLFDKQHGKRAQALLKSVSDHLDHINWSLPRQLIQKKSLWLTCQILVLLVNTFAADERYPVLNTDILTIPIRMQLFNQQKIFSEFSAAFLKFRLNFQRFEIKMNLIAFVFPNLRTPKTWLDKCLKRTVSEDPSTSSMVKVPNHFWNLRHSNFIILIDHCQVNWVGKISVIDMQNLGTAC